MVETIYDQTQRKYGTRPGSNSWLLDLQSDSLLIALQGPMIYVEAVSIKVSKMF